MLYIIQVYTKSGAFQKKTWLRNQEDIFLHFNEPWVR